VASWRTPLYLRQRAAPLAAKTQWRNAVHLRPCELTMGGDGPVVADVMMRIIAEFGTLGIDFEGRTMMFVSLFQIRRQHIFDPFHECADSARQIAPVCYDEGHGERPATKIGYDLHKRSTL
jgi:hypothetical protein